MTLKKTIKIFLSIFLALSVVFIGVMPGFAAVTYPDGVTQQSAAESAKKTDILVENAAEAFSGMSLSDTVYQMLFSDETLTGLLTEIYSSFGSQTSSFERIGLDLSPKNVAVGLKAYPDVASKVAALESWENAEIKDAKWGVDSKDDFAAAVSAMLTPFNDVLYMLLASGTYTAGLTIHGGNGYKDAVISMLDALGCTEITASEQFKAQADSDRSSMIKNLIFSVLSMLDSVLAAPATRLCEIMPNLAHYIKDGGFENSVNVLMNPLTFGIGNYISLFQGSKLISILMFIQDPSRYTTNFSDNITAVLNSATESSGLKLAEIDLEALAGCGTLNGDKVIANIGEAYTTIMLWLIETIKLNGDKLDELTARAGGQTGSQNIDLSKIASGFLDKPSDEILAMLVKLLTNETGSEYDYRWETVPFTPAAISYTQNLGKEKFQRVLDGIDSLLDEVAAELSNEKNIQQAIKKAIYSPDLVTQLAAGIYGALGNENLAFLAKALSLPATPAQLAQTLTEIRFVSAKSTLSRAKSWDDVKKTGVRWGFSQGDKSGFTKAIIAVLNPFEPLIKMLLAGGKVEILGSINICGSNGYNTAVIPLFEALGCNTDDIPTYSEFKAKADNGQLLESLLTPITGLIDKIAQKPVYTITAILPNLLTEMQNGTFTKAIENLLKPVFDLIDEIGLNTADLGVNLDEIKNVDLTKTITDAVTKLAGDKIKLDAPDLKLLASAGQAVNVTSKRTFGGEPQQVQYIQSDQTAVLVTLLRYLVDTIKKPENVSLISDFMSNGGNDAFAQYSSDIPDQMAQMTTDETIEWLYKLFFRERAVSNKPQEPEPYTATIIYQPKKQTDYKKLIPFAIILVIIGIFVFINRKRISYVVGRHIAARRKQKAAQEV